MLLTETVWHELMELGVLEGEETCALCRERPRILLDVARAPVLLCAAHGKAMADRLNADLKQLARNEVAL